MCTIDLNKHSTKHLMYAFLDPLPNKSWLSSIVEWRAFFTMFSTRTIPIVSIAVDFSSANTFNLNKIHVL